ncbi:hypothetical protein F66182_553 [Fusarium sp. NRRL 66182]|nr:hypothetical protein F66182_553 [Fusarium sp. NRRL 66182]
MSTVIITFISSIIAASADMRTGEKPSFLSSKVHATKTSTPGSTIDSTTTNTTSAGSSNDSAPATAIKPLSRADRKRDPSSDAFIADPPRIERGVWINEADLNGDNGDYDDDDDDDDGDDEMVMVYPH